MQELFSNGWCVFTVWECELKNPDEALRALLERLKTLE